MLIPHDPDRYVVVSSRQTCAFHQKNPGKNYAGCTCGGSYGHRLATPEEYRANRKKTLEERKKILEGQLEEVNAELKLLKLL